jgi:hypothetical protein
VGKHPAVARYVDARSAAYAYHRTTVRRTGGYRAGVDDQARHHTGALPRLPTVLLSLLVATIECLATTLASTQQEGRRPPQACEADLTAAARRVHEAAGRTVRLTYQVAGVGDELSAWFTRSTGLDATGLRARGAAGLLSVATPTRQRTPYAGGTRSWGSTRSCSRPSWSVPRRG